MPFFAVGIAGLLEGLGQVPLPMALRELAIRIPATFTAHMIAASLTLILVVPLLAARRRPALHRPLGRIVAVAALVGGLTALPVAALGDAPPLARAGFVCQGLVWLALTAAGYLHIRARRISAHRDAMIAMVAVMSGALLVRFMLTATVALGMDSRSAYGVVAWAAWILPLGAVTLWSRRRRPKRAAFTA